MKIWNDEKFMKFSDDAKLVFLFLLTHPHMTSMGAMRASAAGLAAELGWNTARMDEALVPPTETKMVVLDKITSFLWIPKFLEYNEPESPNVVRSWAIQADMIPESIYWTAMMDAIRARMEALGEPFAKAFREAFDKPSPHPSPNPEPEPEPEPEKSKPRGGATKAAAEIEIPEDLKAHKDAIQDWLAYKREKGQGYKGVKGLEALWRAVRAIPGGRVREAADHSMSNNYTGLFAPKGGTHGKPANSFRADGHHAEAPGKDVVVL